jgi:post-segregation antitoxin (ccd killing protein)
MQRAMNAAIYAQGDVYWRIEDPRSELNEVKSQNGIPYVGVLEKSNEV